MDRVGGYAGYEALAEDARAYEDVVLALLGEADAAKWQRMKQEANRGNTA